MDISPMAQAPAPARIEDPDDLQTQLEALLRQVWLCEAEWRLDDRIDVALRWTR